MKFKIGDTIAAYNNGTRWVREVLEVRDELIICNADSQYHPKQCRILKKKERRRVWIGDGEVCHRAHPHQERTCLEFIEVRRK